MPDIESPRALTPEDDFQTFDCGEESLNQWLRLRAEKSDESGNARTYVCVARATNRVVGYFCLSAGSISIANSPGRLSRNSADPIPVIVIGRLAVDTDYQSRGVGKVLLVDALRRSTQAAEQIGARAVVVNPINAETAAYYEQRGFSSMAKDPSTLYVLLKDVRATFAHY